MAWLVVNRGAKIMGSSDTSFRTQVARPALFFAEDLFHRMKLAGPDFGVYPLCELAQACGEMAVGKNFQGG
jgi:hypothetical protein